MDSASRFPSLVSFESNECLDDVVRTGDIVSRATNLDVPLIMGATLKEGSHLDLVGSFKHSMKECDDEAIRRGRVFIDNGATTVEAEELVGAFERGVITRDEIEGTLVELVRAMKMGRRDSSEITVFKSVGSAVLQRRKQPPPKLREVEIAEIERDRE